ncbi:hypothetical protein N22_038 [Idiomarinaceae phage 1N2-2]|uniref:hypothetical protein n=1 Tax=Idiomarinaceae phage 1N2-2 TaxID=1536592 RepID=UPI0004F66E86|nr:hypothetical protein N22_038 [Idiomarinaceae phage 1N2-2]AIM40740.1 hypothetical protein N22_038 [Idiomarinaceae phage 1N2-2]
MNSDQLMFLWDALPREVKWLIIRKDGVIIPAVKYSSARIHGGGYPLISGIDVERYDHGWTTKSITVDDKDLVEIIKRGER